MDETELKQCVDFLSIALECLDSDDDEVAIDFIEDVADLVDDERQAADLDGAADYIASGDQQGGRAVVEQVSSELMEEIDTP